MNLTYIQRKYAHYPINNMSNTPRPKDISFVVRKV